MKSTRHRTIFALLMGGLVVLGQTLVGVQSTHARFLKEDHESEAHFEKRCVQEAHGKVVHYDGLEMTLCENTAVDIECAQKNGQGWLVEDGHCVGPPKSAVEPAN